MQPDPVLNDSLWFDALVVFTIVASLTTLATMAVGMARGKVLAYEPRRPVPWTWFELLLILVAQILIVEAAHWADAAWFGSRAERPRQEEPVDEELQAAHPLVVLLQQSPAPGTLALAVLVAVVIAPVTEEFLFRLVILGWLERLERRARRRVPLLRAAARGSGPLLLTSIMFAAMHYRAEPLTSSPQELVRIFATTAVVSLTTLGFGITILRAVRRATWQDLGVVPAELWPDICLGLQSFLALLAPIYLLQFLLRVFFTTHPIVDPISLFFFSLALGLLYLRTHRIVPSIVLHMALNATSLAMAWAIAPA